MGVLFHVPAAHLFPFGGLNSGVPLLQQPGFLLGKSSRNPRSCYERSGFNRPGLVSVCVTIKPRCLVPNHPLQARTENRGKSSPSLSLSLPRRKVEDSLLLSSKGSRRGIERERCQVPKIIVSDLPNPQQSTAVRNPEI